MRTPPDQFNALRRHDHLLEQAIQLRPDYLIVLNELAWILATHPQQESRNGKRAVELAEHATKINGDVEPRYYGTLDAACAEAGRFENAITTAEKTSEMARAKGQTNVMDGAETRLKNYRQQKPFRQ